MHSAIGRSEDVPDRRSPGSGVQLVRAIKESKAWRKTVPLPDAERIRVELGADKLPISPNGDGPAVGQGAAAEQGAAAGQGAVDASGEGVSAPRPDLVQLEPTPE